MGTILKTLGIKENLLNIMTLFIKIQCIFTFLTVTEYLQEIAFMFSLTTRIQRCTGGPALILHDSFKCIY